MGAGGIPQLSFRSGRDFAGRGDRERVDATARAVIESAADAIVAFSTDRTVMLWNPARGADVPAGRPMR